MTKGTYHYAAGTGALMPVECERSEAGDLTRSGESVPFCCGAGVSETPKDGMFTPEGAEEKTGGKKSGKGKGKPEEKPEGEPEPPPQ